jgi:hypothetical protein
LVVFRVEKDDPREHVNAAVGDTGYETGSAILVNLNNAVERRPEGIG